MLKRFMIGFLITLGGVTITLVVSVGATALFVILWKALGALWGIVIMVLLVSVIMGTIATFMKELD